MARPKLQVTKMTARLERLAAEREARARTRPITEVYVYLSREELERVEQERRLYAFAPSRSAVLRQLVVEGLMFRKAHRPPPPRPAKRAPLRPS
jgi:hypothetical protein